MPAQTGRDGVPDVMQGVAAAIDEPIAGGRHKVFGHHELAVIPQTSTIASHLPRAVGVAIAIDRARKLGVACPWPDDAIVVCSFGDASLNHATAQAALNTAAHAAHQHLPVPLLFVCEDNGIGISVPTPAGWVASALSSRAALRYETRRRRRSRRRARRCARARRLGARDAAGRRSSTCAPFATSATPAPTSRPPTARPPTCAPTSSATRSSRPAAWLVAAGVRTGAELAADYLEARSASARSRSPRPAGRSSRPPRR